MDMGRSLSRPWRERTSAAERTLSRRDFVGSTRIDGERRTQSPRQSLETGFGNMMVVGAIERGDMQRHAAVHGECLEPFLHQLGVEGADLVAPELGLEHQERPAGNIERDAGQRLVHGHVNVGITGDALHVAQRLLHRLAERDADVLGGVVVIDVEIALGLDGQIDTRMARQQVEHVVEEADSGRNRRRTGPVEVDCNLDVGFLGGALDRTFAHERVSSRWTLRGAYSCRRTGSSRFARTCAEPRAFYQGSPAFATAASAIAPSRQDAYIVSKHGHPRMQPTQSDLWHGTTILTVRKGGVVAVGGDGQVSIGQTIVKANAKKVRRLGKGDVIGGFAGATADAFTLFERLEAKLEQYPSQLTRAAVELAKDWRTDRYLRRLEAMMIVADAQVSLVLTGTGDVLEPESGIMGIGSGGNYALAAARALIDGPLEAEAIVRKAMDIAADICVYTNRNITIETLQGA